ncbi:reticulon-4 receptor-like 2 [Alligator mississippiensis]|uniref:Reticulon-4 receptor-like 2 n=1 Tax=Alligator mississippiensis TaxID=8496 RepID=A0A151NVA3_ALLMI|nr:reticulon-4 receptor-like 2 [Alligator mississippiensis]KYO40718.1 reticulon-4 receptor-like 2 [Alligator mississippiensis]
MLPRRARRPPGWVPTLFGLFVLLGVLPTGAPTCPMLCTCYFSPPTVSCQANNFSSVPLVLPPNAQRLFLQNNLIRSLRAGTFGPSTVTLWLYSNNISSIQPGTFRHLPALEELDLGDNRNLRSLEPDTFRGLERLQSLHLYRCQLSSLPSTIFRGLFSLQYLYLQENSLMYLQDDLFVDLANLSHLFLHGNKIRLLSENVFRGLWGLDRLLLHVNRLHSVHRWAFRDLAKLTILYLFNNSLAVLPGETLADLPSLEFLRLNNNPWACDCRAHSLWAWFQRTRVSSSDVTCTSPAEHRGRDLRRLSQADFRACPPANHNHAPARPAPGTKPKWGGEAVAGRPRGNGSSNHLYGLGEVGAPPADPSSFYRDLPANDIRSPKYDSPTEDDYWNGYGNEEGRLKEGCTGAACSPLDSGAHRPGALPTALSCLVLLLLRALWL